jgi:hypothetical protein
MSCMQRWNWRYNELLQKPGVIPFPLIVGSGFHDSMEQFYKTKGARVNVATLQFREYDVASLNDYTALNYWNALLPVMMEAYAIYYKADPMKWNIHSVEEDVDITYRGFRLRGKIDLEFSDNDGRWILDHKTTSKLSKDVVAGWDFRFQFMFYIWLKSKIPNSQPLKGYWVNAVKKTELRVKKSESLPEFAERVKQDMIIEPDKYFFRDRFLVNKGALDHFEKSVVDKHLDILQFVIQSPDVPLARSIIELKNTSECQKWGGRPCEYIDLCRFGRKDMEHLYINKPTKHEELEEATE